MTNYDPLVAAGGSALPGDCRGPVPDGPRGGGQLGALARLTVILAVKPLCIDLYCGGESFDVYKCPWCLAYHVGHATDPICYNVEIVRG